MVGMVVFIVLYMMVYHLSFYTVMEEKIAHVRHGDIQGQDALYSVAQLVMAQLTEDIVQDYSGGAEDPAASAPAARARRKSPRAKRLWVAASTTRLCGTSSAIAARTSSRRRRLAGGSETRPCCTRSS